MKSVLIYGGTTEGRQLAKVFTEAGLHCTVCVATEYGEMIMDKMSSVTLLQGRMTVNQMEELVEKESFVAVVDATHPFATEVTQNIKASLNQQAIPYLRLKREMEEREDVAGNIQWFPNVSACAEALKSINGNILLTTGSKELEAFCQENLKERLYVRVLPSVESISLCEKNGIQGKQIIAMQGPFTVEMNEALMKQFQIDCMVTKESGATGGFSEKIQAANQRNIPTLIIGNPEKEEKGLSFSETVDAVMKVANITPQNTKLQITLVGTGMGNDRLLTLEAKEAIEQADIVYGAERLLFMVPQKTEKYPYYLANDILPSLKKIIEDAVTSIPIKVAILFSGDTGFYSGADKLYKALQEATEIDKWNIELSMIPGISSLSYLASKVGVSWKDIKISSIHGHHFIQDRKVSVLEMVRKNKRTFLLVSGVQDMNYLGELLNKHNMTDLVLRVGYQLSYPEEEILTLSPLECGKLEKDGLYCCIIENHKLSANQITHGKKDDSFIRGNVPMTKEEIRDISICKLKLHEDSILYDIGSGTGSIAVECGLLSDNIQVYAIEKNLEAIELIKKNCEKFSLQNVKIIPANAPQGMEELPVPTHAFIGGSGGNIEEILNLLYTQNPTIRVVMNGITLETVGQMTKLLDKFSVVEEDLIQVQVNRSKKIGTYHLMQAENPIYILSFNLREVSETYENT